MRQTGPTNEYFSPRGFAFLLASLRELDSALRARGSHLHVYAGEPASVVRDLVQRGGIDAVFVNKDYTPFSRRRDGEIKNACVAAGVAFERCDDASLPPLESLKTRQGSIYSVFTPFMKRAREVNVALPIKNKHENFFSGRLACKESTIDSYNDRAVQSEHLQGGRAEGLRLLKQLKRLDRYDADRNAPALDKTSRLSAHHKYGTISIRETFHAARKASLDEQFVSELYWRDFYMYVAYHFPHVFGRSFLPWGDRIEWANDKEQFDSWCKGMTGVPIVDAGMRQLNKTGWMHNRARMIVASFLTKNLLVDWRWGEKYFARQLVDYDPAANNGGWQWSASVGADPRPLRIFNPYVQARRYDPDAKYIKRWVPELADIDVVLLTDGKERDFSDLAAYPSPLVSQKASYRRAVEAYKEAKTAYAGSKS